MSWDEGDYVKFQVVVDGVATDLVSYDYENAPEALNTADQWAKEKFDLSAYIGKKVKLQIVWNMVPPTEVYFGLENIAFTREFAEIPAGTYKITATIAANEGLVVPEDLQKYVNGYTATGEIAEDGTISTDEPGFVLDGFKVDGGKVILDPAATLTFGDKEFNLGDAKGNTTGFLGVTRIAENSYALDNGTVVYYGNVVGTVTGISIVPVKYGELPAIPANAIYSWQAPKGVVEEVGGTVSVVGGSSKINIEQKTLSGTMFYAIQVADKYNEYPKSYVNIDLDGTVNANDTIVVYGFKSKGDASKSVTPWFKFFDAASTDMGSLYNSDNVFSDFKIEGVEAPVIAKYVVQEGVVNANNIHISRYKKDTNLNMAQIYILPYDAATGISEVNAKAVKSGKFLENGKLVIVKNGAKFNVAGINE